MNPRGGDKIRKFLSLIAGFQGQLARADRHLPVPDLKSTDRVGISAIFTLN